MDASLRAAIVAADGTPVEGKVLGDGVMAVFTSARQAIEGTRTVPRPVAPTGRVGATKQTVARAP